MSYLYTMIKEFIIINDDALLWAEYLTKEQVLLKYGDYLSEEDLKKLGYGEEIIHGRRDQDSGTTGG